MAIVPSRDNFDVGVQQFGARVSGAPAPADVTRNARVLAQGLMAAGRIADEHERIDAAAEANAFAQFLDNQQAALAERKGINAWRNEDGTLVRDTIDQNINDELSRMRSSMSASKREKFDAMILPFQRNFNRNATNYISQQYNAYEKATLDDTKAQYGKMAFANASSDPESALQALNDFHGVARYQAMKDGADEKLADSLANRQTSGIVRGIIDDAVSRSDLKTAKAYQTRYAKVMTFEDVAETTKRIKSLESIESGRSFANAALISDNADPWAMANAFVESGNRKADADGKTLRGSRNNDGTYDYGLYQLNEDNLETAAKLAGVEPDMEKLKNDPEYAALVGKAFAMKIKHDYEAEANGDPRKLFAFYQCSPKTVRKAIAREKQGEDFMQALLSLVPERSRKAVRDGISLKVEKYEEYMRSTPAQLTNTQFALMAKNRYPDNPQAQRAAIDWFATENNARNEAAQRIQQDALMTVYDLVDSGKTMTEIEQSGILDRLNNRNYREAVNYINKNTVYDYDLLAELYSDPNKLMQTDLRKLRGKLPAGEINRLARRQAMGRTEQGKNALEKLTFDMKTVLFQNGINLNSTKKNDIETRALLNDYVTRSLESFRADHKRYPTDKERLEMLKTAVGDVVIPRMFWFPKTVKRFEATPQQYIDSLSTPERMQLVEVANSAGITGTEDEKILAVLRSKGEL